MKILLLVQAEQRADHEPFYSAIQRCSDDCEIQRLTAEQQSDLRKYFSANVDVSKYDRIVFFLRFKKEIKQKKFIQTIPNLVILEHDACQNYMGGKYHGKFSEHYKALPWARVICSGFSVAKKLRSEGFDAAFVGKGYDSDTLRNLNSERSIELGFIGSINNKVYKQRRLLLEAIGRGEFLHVMRTHSRAEYVERLNEIRFFVCPDAGFGEYMQKTFEAMACGCVVLAYDQGDDENKALGFVDMENVVLFSSYDEFSEKLAVLRSNPVMAEQIAAAGQRLVEKNWTVHQMGQEFVKALMPALREKVFHKKLCGLLRSPAWR